MKKSLRLYLSTAVVRSRWVKEENKSRDEIGLGTRCSAEKIPNLLPLLPSNKKINEHFEQEVKMMQLDSNHKIQPISIKLPQQRFLELMNSVRIVLGMKESLIPLFFILLEDKIIATISRKNDITEKEKEVMI